IGNAELLLRADAPCAGDRGLGILELALGMQVRSGLVVDVLLDARRLEFETGLDGDRRRDRPDIGNLELVSKFLDPGVRAVDEEGRRAGWRLPGEAGDGDQQDVGCIACDPDHVPVLQLPLPLAAHDAYASVAVCRAGAPADQ